MDKTVVVIEDAPHVQLLIRQALSPLDTRIVAAADGAAGWEQVEELIPDLVILDLALPKRNGWEVLQLMRSAPATAAIPIVVITAHGQSGMADAVRRSGAEVFLEKPFNPVDLRAHVDALLGTSA